MSSPITAANGEIAAWSKNEHLSSIGGAFAVAKMPIAGNCLVLETLSASVPNLVSLPEWSISERGHK